MLYSGDKTPMLDMKVHEPQSHSGGLMTKVMFSQSEILTPILRSSFLSSLFVGADVYIVTVRSLCQLLLYKRNRHGVEGTCLNAFEFLWPGGKRPAFCRFLVFMM
jgi:hypothetical protein